MDEENPTETIPIEYSTLILEQNKDANLQTMLKNSKLYHLHTLHGAGKQWKLICYGTDHRIVVPNSLQHKVIDWYHTTLVHPGRDRTELTISQHFYWKGMCKQIKQFCKKCPTCQMSKRQRKKYGKLPAKEAEAIPWQKLCVDLIGPYNIKVKGKRNKHEKPKTLWCVTMVDPATSWFKMKQIESKDSFTVATVVEQTWLSRYPWPQLVTYDKGTEFMGEFA